MRDKIRELLNLVLVLIHHLTWTFTWSRIQNGELTWYKKAYCRTLTNEVSLVVKRVREERKMWRECRKRGVCEKEMRFDIRETKEIEKRDVLIF
jgi:hypothetical protein